jgi:hypothetical protein
MNLGMGLSLDIGHIFAGANCANLLSVLQFTQSTLTDCPNF